MKPFVGLLVLMLSISGPTHAGALSAFLDATEDPAIRQGLIELETKAQPITSADWIQLAELAVANDDASLALSLLKEAKAIGADDFEFHYLSGYCAEKNWEISRALTSYVTALNLQPDYTAGWLRTAYLRMVNGDIAGMISTLERLEGKAQNDPLWLALMGHKATNESDWTSAVNYFAAALQADPGATGLFVPLATALRKSGDSTSAKRALAQRGTRQPGPDDSIVRRIMSRSTSPTRLADSGIKQLNSGDTQGAKILFERALKFSDEGYPEATYGLGYIAESQGDLQAAEQAYRAVLDHGARHDRAALRLAGLLSKKNEPEARQWYDLALQIDPESFAGHLNYANWLRRQDQCDQAVEHYVWVSQNHAGDRRGWQGAILCLDTAAARQEQLRFATLARRSLPDDAKLTEYWVRIASIKGSTEPAARVVDTARALAMRQRRAGAYEALAMALARNEQFDEALKILEQIERSQTASGKQPDNWTRQLRQGFERGVIASTTGLSSR